MSDFISIIIPVYNSGEQLYDCVKSIQNSTYKHFEIIIVDDGSNDESYEYCEEIFEHNDEKIFRKICEERNMIVTAGSDYHGIIDYSHEDLAYNVLEGEDLDRFLKRLGEK